MRLFQRRREWGLELSGFGRPFGIGIGYDGGLLVTDMDCNVVVRFDPEWRTFQWHDGGSGWAAPALLPEGVGRGRPRSSPRGWHGPHSVAADPAGSLLVCCYYQPMIAALLPSGRCERLIGEEFLSGPATARVDQQGRMLVAEYAQNLVLAFDPDGTYCGRLGRSAANEILCYDAGRGPVPPSSLPGGFDRPHMAISLADGSLLVADTWNNRLQRFSPQGEWQVWPNADMATSCPVAIDEDSSGRILVTAWDSGELLLFGPDRRRLRLGGMPRLDKPYDARFYRDGLVVADSHNGRVLVFDELCLSTVPRLRS